MSELILLRIACCALFGLWYMRSREVGRFYKTCVQLDAKYIELLGETKQAMHDRLHYFFAAAILSQAMQQHRIPSFSASVLKNPELQTINTLLSRGELQEPSKLAATKLILPNVKLDIDDRGGVLGVEVIGAEEDTECNTEWEGNQDD